MKNVNIKALNIELTDAIESYFREKLNHLDKFIDLNDESFECEARVSKSADKHHHSGDLFKAEVSMHTAGKNFGAVAERENLYAAIDEVQESLSRKMDSYHKKHRSIFRRSASRIKELLKGLRN